MTKLSSKFFYLNNSHARRQLQSINICLPAYK